MRLEAEEIRPHEAQAINLAFAGSRSLPPCNPLRVYFPDDFRPWHSSGVPAASPLKQIIGVIQVRKDCCRHASSSMPR